MPIELFEGKGGVFLSIHVVTGSKTNNIVGIFGKKLKVKVKSPPVDNRANEEIVNFFASCFDLSRSNIQIVKGTRSKSKVIFLEGLSKEFVLSKLDLKKI